ncbi:hypothetical protein F5883DRAFT_722819 [Diaporthe sp. PMI_573]|nr:hypothetical protein F5883DRAFT_722819 [Diaporthaceae sp. PMI_573]
MALVKAYDNLGTPQSPFFSPGIWMGNTFGEPGARTNLEQFEDFSTPQLPALDVFAMETVNTVFKDQAAVARMRQFAQSRGRYKDIDFLMKVDEYSNTMNMVSLIMANISTKFTGVAAPQPIRLPMAVSKSLNTDKKLSLPRFYRGLKASDSPIVFVSDGLAGLTGYNHDEIVDRNCRFLQGPGTRASGVDRIRDTINKNQEWSELLLNYRKDRRVFWNLLVTAHLMGLDGQVRYHLGGQVDVTEVLESQESVAGFLAYDPPLRDRKLTTPDEHEDRGSWCNAFSKERRPARDRDAKYLPQTPLPSPYSRFIVLEYIPTGSTGSSSDKKSLRAQLPVAFCSAAVMDSLNNGSTQKCLADVIRHNVFKFLSVAGNSPSVNKSFKATVRASIAEGRPVKLDLTLNGNSLRKSRGLSLSRESSGVCLTALGLGGGESAPSTPSHGRSLRKSMGLERLAPLNHGGAEDFVSYWTPLKDAQRATRFVVVVLIPEVC